MGGSCAHARALSRWLLGEHNLEVETGRYHRVVASERWCKCCLPWRSLGNELHALTTCRRAATTKMQCSLELMDIFEKAKIDTGVDALVGELLRHIRLLPTSDQCTAWKLV